MPLIDNFQSVLKNAWSIRLALFAAIFSAAEVALPFFTDIIPPHTMALLATITAAGAAVARVIAQPAMAQNDAQAKG